MQTKRWRHFRVVFTGNTPATFSFKIVALSCSISVLKTIHAKRKLRRPNIFNVMFPAVFPLEPTFWLAHYVLYLWFSKQKSSSSKRWFHWRILRGIFPVKTTRKWRHLFVWVLLHCNFFVIRYIFWLKLP